MRRKTREVLKQPKFNLRGREASNLINRKTHTHNAGKHTFPTILMSEVHTLGAACLFLETQNISLII